VEMEEEEQGPSFDVVEQEFSFTEYVYRLVLTVHAVI
jgi:hypothetical protein